VLSLPVLITASHLAVGALCFATSVVLAVRSSFIWYLGRLGSLPTSISLQREVSFA